MFIEPKSITHRILSNDEKIYMVINHENSVEFDLLYENLCTPLLNEKLNLYTTDYLLDDVVVRAYDNIDKAFIITTKAVHKRIVHTKVNDKLGEQLERAFNYIIDTGRTVDPTKWVVSDAVAKLFEEGGEFSQAIQTKVGKLKKDLPKNAHFDECADVIMCTLDTLSQACPELSPAELISRIIEYIHIKVPIWQKKIIEAGYAKNDPESRSSLPK